MHVLLPIPEMIFCHFFWIFGSLFASLNSIDVDATPPTVVDGSFWKFAGVFDSLKICMCLWYIPWNYIIFLFFHFFLGHYTSWNHIDSGWYGRNSSYSWGGFFLDGFLAHLSYAQDELLWSLFVLHPCVRPCMRPSVNIFKRLLLWSPRANFAQISYKASLGWGNEKLLKWSRSIDQDGRHAHIW